MKSDQVENFPGALPSNGSREEIKKRGRPPVRMMRSGSEDIVVGENSALEGSFETQGSMFVDGNLMGTDLRAMLLSIGATGSVAGKANVTRAEIAGTFDGHLNAEGEVILRATAHVSGEITCGKLVSHRGACVRAHVTVLEDELEYSEVPLDPKILPVIQFQKRLSRRFVQRAMNFAYGVGATLGLIGLVSYF
ncbi:MAG: polymer-forming cytoskeletal protein [Parvibaculum sp.]